METTQIDQIREKVKDNMRVSTDDAKYLYSHADDATLAELASMVRKFVLRSVIIARSTNCRTRRELIFSISNKFVRRLMR
jgi:2-iminoacetate synthase ThiH